MMLYQNQGSGVINELEMANKLFDARSFSNEEERLSERANKGDARSLLEVTGGWQMASMGCKPMNDTTRGISIKLTNKSEGHGPTIGSIKTNENGLSQEPAHGSSVTLDPIVVHTRPPDYNLASITKKNPQMLRPNPTFSLIAPEPTGEQEAQGMRLKKPSENEGLQEDRWPGRQSNDVTDSSTPIQC